ncbi:MAG: nuclear transport factor 2 family protein [bacterium]|nr:nuclear transport factor 2 family protein [bacterium]
MIKRYLMIITSVIMLFSCSGVPEDVNDDAEIAKISESIDSVIGWFKEKDFDRFFSVIAHDSDYVSVQPNRIVKGFALVERNSEIYKDPAFKYVRHEIRDLQITLSRSKDVAWFSCILDDLNEWRGEPANWENTRWTGVLEKRDDHWVVVQQHFSFASDR